MSIKTIVIMRKLRFLLIMLLFSTICKAQTLHLIMVSDYADPKFGVISQADEESMLKIFKTVEWGLGYKIKISYLNSTNNMFDKASVIKSLDSFNTKTLPNDIIVFFYSGLGYYPPKSKSTFPTFKLNDYKESTISLDDIAQILTSKNVRLGIVLADCRDTFPIEPQRLALPLMVTEDLRKLIIRKLFLEKTGVLKIASASKGNPTWKKPYSENSAYIYSFNNVFAHSLQSNAESIPLLSLENILKKTQTIMEGYLQGFIPADKPQFSHWEFLPNNQNLNNKIIQYPLSTFIIPTPKELSEQLTILVNSTDSLETKNAASKLINLFTKNATIEIKEKEDILKQMTIEAYIAQTAKYDKKKRRSIIFDFTNFKRTEDFKKFSSLRLTEITEKE